MPARKKKPRDLNLLALAVVEEATCEDELTETDDWKDPAAVALGRKGGLKGGKARAEKLSAARRREIAKLAVAARWGKDLPTAEQK